MAKEEIIAGLQNAVARGEPLEKAVGSMILAGYPPAEVEDSARYVNMGIIGRASPSPQQSTVQSAAVEQNPITNSSEKNQAAQISNTAVQEPQKKKSGKLKLILLVLILIILVGLMIFIFFGKQIISSIFGSAVEAILSLL